MKEIKPKNVIHLVISVALGLAFFFGMTTPIAILPPLGDFIDPSVGIWNTATNAVHPKFVKISVPELSDTVTIYRDKYGIPHIYAKTDNDLYWAQGYVHAQDRLWQLEIQRRAFSGELSEVLGSNYVNIDTFFRQLGLYRTSKESLELMKSASDTIFQGLQAYADGINYYIDHLSPKDLPFEFKLLNFKPSRWNVIDTLAFGKLMAYQLAYGDEEVQLSTLCSTFPENDFNELFPFVRPYQTPIIPDYGAYEMPDSYNWRPNPAKANFTDPSLSEECSTVPEFLKQSTTLYKLVDQKISSIETGFGRLKDEFRGSNNWVVSGNYTDTGKPYLQNDMHLGLTLPPIWYQISLHTQQPEKYDWWGFSFIGVPMIIAGHNQYAAWGFTNVGADALDWFYFKESSDGTKYYYNGSWLDYNIVKENIPLKGGGTQEIEIKETIYGPMVSVDEYSLVMRWTGYNRSTIFQSVYDLNRVKNIDDYQEALKMWDIPGQNVVFADVNNNIAMRVTGFYPIRAKGHGRFVVNASADPDMNRWIGYIPYDDMPHSVNPDQGYLQSANQRSVGPNYSYYLSSSQAPGYRGRRIDFLLNQAVTKGSISIEDLKKIQTDNFDSAAHAFIPILLNATANSTLASQYKKGIENWDSAISTLKNWDFVMDRDKSAPLIYWFFLLEFRDQTYLDEYQKMGVESLDLPRPEVLEYFTRTNNTSKWFDNVSTSIIETRDEIMLSSFRTVLTELTDKYGSDVNSWKWGDFHRLWVKHQIGGALNDEPRPWDGSAFTINAARPNSDGYVGGGPSERAIYDLSDFSNSVSTLPGGQSGNPLSPHYKDLLVNYWYTFRYYPMYWYLDESKFPNDLIESTLILEGGS